MMLLFTCGMKAHTPVMYTGSAQSWNGGRVMITWGRGFIKTNTPIWSNKFFFFGVTKAESGNNGFSIDGLNVTENFEGNTEAKTR